MEKELNVMDDSGVHGGIAGSEIIPTTKGYKKVSDIKFGDNVFDYFGFPQMVIRTKYVRIDDVYEVAFKDGRTIKISKDKLMYYSHMDKFAHDDFTTFYDCNSLSDMCLEYDLNNPIGVPVNYAIDPKHGSDTNRFLILEDNKTPYEWAVDVMNGKRDFDDRFLFASMNSRHDALKGVFDTKATLIDTGIALDCSGLDIKNITIICRLIWSFGCIASYDEDSHVINVLVYPNHVHWFFRFSKYRDLVHQNLDDEDWPDSVPYEVVKVTKLGKEPIISITIGESIHEPHAMLIGYGFTPVASELND